VEYIVEKINDDIWVHEDAMSLLGMHLPLRMTIVKLSSGSLWVHSPTELSSELKQAIEALGPVQFLVEASNGHMNWLVEWQQAFPDAVSFVSRGVAKKLKLTGHNLLDETSENIWDEDLLRVYTAGVPFFNESVFLHKTSKSLIVSDLIQHYNQERASGLSGFMSRFIFEPLGFKGMCIAPPLKMGFMVKDRPSFVASIKQIQELDFDKIIVAHGEIIQSNAKQEFARLLERFLK
jgi:hypothetical protein